MKNSQRTLSFGLFSGMRARVSLVLCAGALTALFALIVAMQFAATPAAAQKGAATFKLAPKFGEQNRADENLNPLHVEGVEFKKTSGHTEGEFSARPGDTVEVKLKLKLDAGFHAYVDQYKLKLVEPADFYLSEFQVQPTVRFNDPISKKVKLGTEDFAEMVSLLDIPRDARGGSQEFKFELTYQACGADFCLFPKTIAVKAKLQIEGGEGGMVADALAKSLWSALLLVFVAGVLTSLTPCIFPMIPITLAILGTTEAGRSRRKGFLLSLAYVIGIAFTYSILGVIAAKTGALFGSFLGHPVVVGAIALVFVLMGLSMYGVFEIRMPAFLANKIANTKTQKNYFGAFASGLLAGVVASPCVGPVLISVLTYVAQTQNVSLGFILLFTFALGLGQLFLVIGTFSTLLSRLPRSGPWMKKVQVLFGTMMIAMAVYYVYPVLPKEWRAKMTFSTAETEAEKKFATPDWQVYSDAKLAEALKAGRPVIVDFKADWCLACKELEAYTFSDPQVLAAGREFLWLAFDATSPSPELDVLRQRYSIGGLPFVILFDKKGQHRKDLTLTGFEKAEPFLERMKLAN